MKYNSMFSELDGVSVWDTTVEWQLVQEIERLDKANRRKRKALRELTKAVEQRNKEIEDLLEQIAFLEKENVKLDEWIVDLL